ncbi:MAG: response regulator [Tepidibacillus sp.]
MVKLLIVDDHEVVRLGLISLLQLHPSFEVVGEANSEEKAVKKATQLKPDVIIMDVKLSMQGGSKQESGIEACRLIKEKCPETKVIMLSSFGDDESIYESIMAGASGYILKGLDGEELIRSIELVSEGKSLLDPNITAKVFQKMKVISNQQKLLQDFTSQEKEVLRLLAQGLTNKEIAEELGLVEKTVRNYVSQILAKLEVKNRIEAASYVLKNKLFD